jgi:hypothetical protein
MSEPSKPEPSTLERSKLEPSPRDPSPRNLSRRKLITTGLAATAGIAGLGVAARLAQRYGLIPPDHGGFYGFGETLTYASQRLLTRHSLAREFSRSQISQSPFPNEMPPLNDAFKSLQAGGFADWRLSVSGMVAKPASFSLTQLKSYPSRSQITMVQCEEGWSYIGSGSACRSRKFCKLSKFTRKPDTLCISRSIPTGGKVSIWPTPCTRRLFSRMG